MQLLTSVSFTGIALKTKTTCFLLVHFQSLWLATLSKLNCQNFTYSWDLIQDWLLSTHGSFKFKKKKLIFHGHSIVVYTIWRERNKSFQSITNEVLQNIRFNAFSWNKIRKSHTNWIITVNLASLCIFSHLDQMTCYVCIRIFCLFANLHAGPIQLLLPDLCKISRNMT